MLSKILAARGLMSAAVVLVVVLAAGIGLTVSKSAPATRGYCAELPDSVGLYTDSAVTIMGVQVGKITAIDPRGPTTRVRFTVRADRTLPQDVGAVTVSNTLITDRNLALIGAQPRGQGWDPDRCITKTLTPKSLSQTFDALATLADQLGTADDPTRPHALDTLDRATAGTGDEINAVIQQLSKALASPDAAIGHIGQLLDALTDLAHRARVNWPELETTVTHLTETFRDINTLAFPPVADIVTALVEFLPQVNDVIMMIGSPALRELDTIANLPQLLAAGVGTLADVIRMTPAIATGFADAVDPTTGRFTIGYAAPKLALPQQNTDVLCAALQSLARQQCRQDANGAPTVPALPALLAAVSRR
ncbi:MlaD family protein [Nocardia callitridis]|uniref:Mce/MlaD domain-containing protein n=1 Tax=Nocardia callitridis TaxID=648753 RepID=A0ABP9KV08_9NOCA